MEKELRKQENTLVVAGKGIMMFAVWSAVKVNLMFALAMDIRGEAEMIAQEIGIPPTFLLCFFLFFVFGYLLIDLTIRMYIGLNATAEGKGKPRGYGYMVCGGALLISNVLYILQTMGVSVLMAENRIDAIISLCMELTSIYILLELLIAGFHVKKLRKLIQR